MSRKWYGSLNNRFEENRMFCEEITIGTGMTEYMYSDRHPYEVIAVKDQKHVTVRKLDHKHVGDGCMDNNWELISNENNPIREMSKRGDFWYWTTTITSDILKKLESDDAETRLMTSLFLCHNNVDIDKLREKGKLTKYHKANVSFGVAEYHYDYEF
jgi:hypothetical protein